MMLTVRHAGPQVGRVRSPDCYEGARHALMRLVAILSVFSTSEWELAQRSSIVDIGTHSIV